MDLWENLELFPFGAIRAVGIPHLQTHQRHSPISLVANVACCKDWISVEVGY